MLSRSASRSIAPCSRAISSSTKPRSLQTAHARVANASYQARAYKKQRQLYRSLFVVATAGGAATIWQYYLNDGHFMRSSHAEAPASSEENMPVFENSRKKPNFSKEENRDMISSQHHQVKRSWENPGLYAWGSNAGRVVAPDLPEQAIVKTPRRIAWFDGKLLRDVKLDSNFGAAIDEKGNLVQWGIGYKSGVAQPEVTLQGKDLVALGASRDRILGLGRNGTIYSVPVSAEEQEAGTKPEESSWIPFWSSRSPMAYRALVPKDLAYSEKVTALDCGVEHAVLLTTKGRVFSCTAASDTYPSRGQLGIAGLTWLTRPPGPMDQPHEITTLRGFNVKQIACGDYHSLALDSDGRVFSWGDNASGQLGFDFNAESSIVDAPSLLPTQKMYSGTSQSPNITSIAAGGDNSYITVDAKRVAAQGLSSEDAERQSRSLGRISADTFAFGSGIRGNLGSGRWTHVQSKPAKIPALSGLYEYNERKYEVVPIRLARLSVGATHAAAVMANITYLGASDRTSDDDTNWGADIVFWGGNEHYQLGTGRRNNVSTPVYIQPLDIDAEIKRAKKSSGAKEEHRLHVTPRTTARLGDGRRVSVEQRVECGRNVTCIYSGT